ncbi:hypothetical protein PFLUV_G00075180 [Perca fluviatilis]|uniref:Uncharacterized protein n=1 Tax=Perca fluviatilis TaxID=8168 RepID=A0A6A5FF30_PERFL|nr:hypothetical protein PFLUV_G00075180 [Perca fluviatilis]
MGESSSQSQGPRATEKTKQQVFAVQSKQPESTVTAHKVPLQNQGSGLPPWTHLSVTPLEENARRREKKRDHLPEGLKQVKRCSYTADGDSQRHPIYFCPGCATVAALCVEIEGWVRPWESPNGIPSADITWLKEDPERGLFTPVRVYKDITGLLRKRRAMKSDRMRFYLPETSALLPEPCFCVVPCWSLEILPEVSSGC